jgi:hypothetical protein
VLCLYGTALAVETFCMQHVKEVLTEMGFSERVSVEKLRELMKRREEACGNV